MANANQLRDDELPEFTIKGPFGGIQSEIPAHLIENFGFRDCTNVMLRKSAFETRNTYSALPAFGGGVERVNGVADFFTNVGNRVQVVFTPTRMFQWAGGAWAQVTGVLTGTNTQLYNWAVVAGKLFFTQGTDIVKVWDGISAGFANASGAAVPARYLAEVDRRLITAFTTEGGNLQPQRYRYSNALDGTDWAAPGAGSYDLYNDLGPITGVVKLFQYGYIFQQWGITQMQPTGSGLNPFYNFSMSAHSKGNICPYSLAAFGEDIAAYVGKDNVYVFDGTSSTPIGDAPVSQGYVRLGAKTAIFQDIKIAGNLNNIFGIITTSINGNSYKAYWLFIPGASTWIYNFEENNWTRFVWDKTPQSVGVFSKLGSVRIIDLLGTIAQQVWSPSTLVNDNPLDSMVINFSNGTMGYFDFTGQCESTWTVDLGDMIFGDARHLKNLKKLRIMYYDKAPAVFRITFQNNIGDIEVEDVSIGTGSGKILTKIISTRISGTFIKILFTGQANQMVSISEITPIFDMGGEGKFN